MLKATERLEPLGQGLRVIVSDEHHFTTDTILLADFAAPKPHETAAELCSGCGTIPLLWNKNGAPRHTDTVELQPEAADMCRRSVTLNGLEEKIAVFCADLRSLKGVLCPGGYDLVACNPPYKGMGSGVLNPRQAHVLARHESTCTMEDAATAAAYLLRFGGRFCMCQRPERLSDLLEAMRRAGMEPKRLRTVQQRPDKPPKLVLVEGKKGTRPGGLSVLPTLVIEDGQGGFSQEMLDIYGDYKNR